MRSHSHLLAVGLRDVDRGLPAGRVLVAAFVPLAGVEARHRLAFSLRCAVLQLAAARVELGVADGLTLQHGPATASNVLESGSSAEASPHRVLATLSFLQESDSLPTGRQLAAYLGQLSLKCANVSAMVLRGSTFFEAPVVSDWDLYGLDTIVEPLAGAVVLQHRRLGATIEGLGKLEVLRLKYFDPVSSLGEACFEVPDAVVRPGEQDSVALLHQPHTVDVACRQNVYLRADELVDLLSRRIAEGIAGLWVDPVEDVQQLADGLLVQVAELPLDLVSLLLE